MLKILAETKGSFQLADIAANQLLPAHRPAVVVASYMVNERTTRDQIRVLGEVKADATDEDFVDYIKEAGGDMQLAIDSFLAEFGSNAVEKTSTSAKKKPAERAPAKLKHKDAA